ncbi:hypothetical protein A9X05_09225 [Mycobacterium sp. E3298]|nr:hypothetical protein A9X05_09225 [Mycobacterium sp. E3298]
MQNINVLPIHQRMAELFTVNKMRDLTRSELDEMAMCLKRNAIYCWEAAYQLNMKEMESIIRDIDWVDE